jgi:hypothetical protein
VKHDCMAMIVPTILLHFLHPWRSDVGGRAMHGAVAEEARTELSREHLEPLTSLSATVHGRCPAGALSTTNFVPDKIVIKYFLNALCLFWSHSSL